MIEIRKVCLSVLFLVIRGLIRVVAEKILELFPLQELPPQEIQVPDLEELAYRATRVQKSLQIQTPVPLIDEDIKRLGELYRRYRAIEELPANAKDFYKKAGESIIP